MSEKSKKLDPPRTVFFRGFIALHGWPTTKSWRKRDSYNPLQKDYSAMYREYRRMVYPDCFTVLENNYNGVYSPLIFKSFFSWTQQERRRINRKRDGA